MVETPALRRAALAIDGEEVVIEDGLGGVPIAINDGQGGMRGPIGILSTTHDLVESEITIATTDPVLLVPSEEIPGVEAGWRVTSVDHGFYEVSEPPRDDGTGMSLLILQRPRP